MKPSRTPAPAGGRVALEIGAALLLFAVCTSQSLAFETRGHVKLQGLGADLPGDSLLQDFSDDPSTDQAASLRLNLSGATSGWSWQGDYQLSLAQGDRVGLRDQPSLGGISSRAFVEDDRRILDLAHQISRDDERIIGHRLDRLYIGHSSDQSVWRIGRQAVSWGNGMIYNPVDFFNPFDPAAIDTEYKTGDDMLYNQYLFESGDDLQAVWVGRRDADGDIESEVASLAIKYHGFTPQLEYDLLVAEHFDAAYYAFGVAADAGESIWRGDFLLVRDGTENNRSAVVNWSYSFVARGHNVSTTIEYYRNGFGIKDGDYGPASLAANPELVARIERGELFSLGKNYLAAAASVEISPLWILTASLFANLDDDSKLLQLLSHHDLQQDLQLLIALNLPRGAGGSEFGGIDSGQGEKLLATGDSLFAQLAWYF